MSNLSLVELFSIFPYLIMVYSDIPLVHVSFLFRVVSFVQHVTLFVFPFIFGFYCFNVDRVSGFQLVRKVLRRFFILWISRFFTEATHICAFHSGLFGSLFWSTFWRFFSISKRRLLSSLSWCFLRFHLWFFFLGLLVLRRHGVKNPGRPIVIFLIVVRCEVENIEGLNLILKKPASGYLVVIMRRPPMFLEGLQNPLHKEEGNVQLLLFLDLI